MSLRKLITVTFLTLSTTLLAFAIARAQTGNTGGSSGGTGSGQSGTGSGPAATSPSTGGGTFTGNPDANPYATKDGKDSFIVETQSTTSESTAVKPRKQLIKSKKKTSSSGSKTKKKKNSEANSSPSPSATAH